MNTITVPEFVKLSGVSKQIIYRHAKAGKTLRYSNGSNKIDLDDPLTQTYLNNPPPQRFSNILDDPTNALLTIEQADQSPLSTRKKNEFATAVKEYADERTRVQTATAEKLEMQNAVRRSELYESELVESQLFLYLDRVHSNLDRLAGSSLTDIIREAIVAGELKPEHKLKWKDACKAAVHEAKLEIMDRLETIKEVQAKG